MKVSYALFCVLGFACGSVLFSWLLPKLLLRRDVCKLSRDENPGAYNVFAHCGIALGTVCVLLDIGKGVLPVWLALRALDLRRLPFSLVLVSPVLGHAFSPLRRFRGGKAIAVGFGVMIAMLPVTRTGFVLAGIYILFSTAVRIRPNRRRSLLAYGLFAVIATPILLARGLVSVAIGYLMIDAVILYMHWQDSSETEAQPEEPDAEERPDLV